LNKMGKYFLGIDGGQSSTTALIGDETGHAVGYGRGGPCNHVKGPEGRTKFLNAINGCVGQARETIGRSEIASICGGFSGGPADKEGLLREMFPESRVFVTGDMLTALTGAIGNEPGIITNAGTGSFAYGRNGAGKTARAGGWGYIFGDEASGFDLTRQALRAALRHEEGWGPATMLTDLLLAETGAINANDLLHHFYTTDWPRPKVAALSRLVDQAAREGDAIAQDILHAAAQQLAGYTSAVRGMLFQRGDEAQISWTGGAFKSEILLLRYQMIVELEDGNHCEPPQYGPAAGALLEAYRQAGITGTLVGVPKLEK
jgi:N-acetylglucosamine kinase-like BadF-type ATPase